MMILSIFDWTFFIGPYKANIYMILLWFVIFGLGFVINKIIKKYLKRFLKNANFRIEGRKIALLKILTQGSLLVTLICAFQVFKLGDINTNVTLGKFLDHNIIDLDKANIVISTLDIILIVLIFIGARIAINLISIYFSKRFKDNDAYDEGTEYVYIQITKYIIYTLVIIYVLKLLSNDLTIILGGAGALLVGIGLGMQDIFRDFISGIILLFEGTIKVGDVIEIEDPNSGYPLVAKVLNINVRTSKIETRDGNVLIVPNSKLTQDNVENWSFGNDLTRFNIAVGVAYGSNTEIVKDLLKQAALSHPKVKKTKPVFVMLKNFGDNALEMELFFWADQSWAIEVYKSEIRFEIDRLFREYKIEIPFPQRTVHLPKE